LPAIFLQHSISAGVIEAFGKQANGRASTQTAARIEATMLRHITNPAYTGQRFPPSPVLGLLKNSLTRRS